HAGIDFRTDVELFDTDGVDHRAGRFTAADHESSDAALQQLRRELAEKLLERQWRTTAAALASRIDHLLGRRRIGDRAVGTQRIQLLGNGIGRQLAGENILGTDGKAGMALEMMSQLDSRLVRATAGKYDGRSIDRPERCGAVGEQRRLAEVLRQTEGDAGTTGDEHRVANGMADRQEIAIA